MTGRTEIFLGELLAEMKRDCKHCGGAGIECKECPVRDWIQSTENFQHRTQERQTAAWKLLCNRKTVKSLDPYVLGILSGIFGIFMDESELSIPKTHLPLFHAGMADAILPTVESVHTELCQCLKQDHMLVSELFFARYGEKTGQELIESIENGNGAPSSGIDGGVPADVSALLHDEARKAAKMRSKRVGVEGE